MTDELLTHIRAALAEGASDMTRQRGVNACRNILAALGAKAGEPLDATAAATKPPSPPSQPSPVVNAARMVATAPPTLILDAVIAKLKAHLPALQSGAEPAPRPAVLRIPFIPVPSLTGAQS